MPATPGQKNLLIGFALLAATFLAYIPAIRSAYVWDDHVILWSNPLIHSPGGLFSFWFSTEPPDYFPLSSSMLWFEWRIFGPENPWGYHLVNVLLHAGSSIILWRLLARLEVPGACFAALLFALHPVNVESVAWIAQRKSTLSLVFALLSALLFFKSREIEEGQEPRGPFRTPHYRWALVAFLLALLAKTSVAMLPVALLIIAWWRTGALTRRDLSRTLPFFALAGVLSVVTIWFQYESSIGDHVVREDGFFSRLAISGWAIWFYLYKAFLPLELTFMYPRWEADPANPLVYLPLLLLLLVAFALWRIRARPWARAAFTTLAIYGVMLFPVLGFFDIYFMRYSLVADHWQYPALPALMALAAAAAAGLAKRVHKRGLYYGLAALVIAALAALTWRQCADYRDEETLWRATIARNPAAWGAHQNLGIHLSENGRTDEAIDHFRTTLLLRPDRAAAHSNLAAALREPDQLEEAIYHRRRVLELDPGQPQSWYDLGDLYSRTGQVEQAIAHFRKALELKPDHADAHAKLGNALFGSGQVNEAITHFRRALELEPGLVVTRFSLANILVKEGNVGEAVAHFEAALRTKPDGWPTLARLAWILATFPDPSVRDGPRALELATRARRLSPDHPEVVRTLAAAYAETGRMEDAVKAARAAIDLASAKGNPALADRIRAELELYMRGSPARDGGIATPGSSPGPNPP